MQDGFLSPRNDAQSCRIAQTEGYPLTTSEEIHAQPAVIIGAFKDG